jgi:LysM domain
LRIPSTLGARTMKKHYVLSIAVPAGIMLGMMCLGCATPQGGTAAGSQEEPRLTLSQDGGTLGGTVRQIGAEMGGSVVLMNGLEERALPSARFNRTKFRTACAQIAEEAGCTVQECPSYTFIYPAGYERLAELSLTQKLDPAFSDRTAAMAFGSGAPLFSVFAWVGEAANTTILADNVVAEAMCGELNLDKVPLDVALEAILKSARVVDFAVDSTEEYVFFHLPANRAARSQLLNPEVLSAQQRAFLDQRVSVSLPKARSTTGQLEMSTSPVRLAEVLYPLSVQLGIRVVAEKDLGRLPVNPAVMNNVKISTVLDLLIRQWPLPDFGYEMAGDRVIIRSRRPVGEAGTISGLPQAPSATRDKQMEERVMTGAKMAAPAEPVPGQAPGGQKPAPAPQPAGEKVMHTVGFGDNPWKIATKYGVSVRDFLLWNELAPDATIQPGQKYVVYMTKAAREKATAEAAAKKAAEEKAAADKAAADKAAADKAAADKAAADKAAAEAAAKKAAEEKAAADKAAAEAAAKKAAEEKAAADKAAAEAAAKKAAEEKAAAEAAAKKAAEDKAAAEAAAKKAAEEKAAADKAAAEAAAKKAAEEKAAADQAAADKAAADKAAADKAAADKAAAEAAAKKAAEEKAAADKAAADKAAADKAAADKAAADKAAADKAAAEAAAKKAAEEKAAADKAAADKAAADKAAAEAAAEAAAKKSAEDKAAAEAAAQPATETTPESAPEG